MDNQAFLSGNKNDEDNFAALDSMAPAPQSFNNYGQQSAPEMSIHASSKPSLSVPSESLFDRIRARTVEQQKQAAAQLQPVSTTQQQYSEHTMEMEKSPDVQTSAVDTAVTSASIGAPSQPTPNETTYSFSGPSDFSSAVPHVPSYGPSRNTQYVSADQNKHYSMDIKDNAYASLNKLWTGAQTLAIAAQDRIKGNARGGGYSTNFLLNEDGLEGGVGAPPLSMGDGRQTVIDENSGRGAISMVSGQAYSMFSYGKTFCEDMLGFFVQLPNWGKGGVIVVVLLMMKFFFY